MVSGRESVLTGIFAIDQHKPLVHYEAPEQASNEPPTSSSGARASNTSLASGLGADLPVAPPDPEVMEMNKDPSAGSDPLPDWRVPYLDYLIQETLLVDKMEIRWLVCRAKSYVIIDGELYKKNHTKVLKRYIPTEQGRKLLEDIHCDACDHHTVPRTLIRNAF
jgi:hypothetical protein